MSPLGDGSGKRGDESAGRGDDSTDSGASDDSHVDPSEAFAALSDPLRVDILRALAAFHRESAPEPVGFADLRKRVDVRDSGRFRYHLNELRDHFVRKADDGYHLTHAGVEIVAAILAGTYTDRGSRGPEPLDSGCSLCDARAVAVYEDGRCAVSCENDHPLFNWSVPPAAASDASLPEIVSLAELLARQAIERTLAGVCPKCSAAVDPAVVAEDAAPAPRLRARCDTCGATMAGPVGFCLLVDPAVEAFYRRHDRPLDERYAWEPAFVADDSTISVADTDPIRVEIAVTLDDETLAVSVDESGRVSVDGSGRGGE
ncbi:winged helix-turn-helix domain-containing protein [Halosimplex aquaticum]|uniref:Winged helix-turn-helix domain-containing protein n=1 Tax=Halosimplex aquaticum TaxID=3026162 RepID=A0ABD5Y327_9EURY|nr:helix-turn-helix domain-containing protein [Halosimplex aquaticum]